MRWNLEGNIFLFWYLFVCNDKSSSTENDSERSPVGQIFEQFLKKPPNKFNPLKTKKKKSIISNAYERLKIKMSKVFFDFHRVYKVDSTRVSVWR